MKTTSFDPRRPKRHVVRIDTDQLRRYMALAPSLRPVYVFPRPRWEGELSAAARRYGIEPTDIAFSRSAAQAPVGWAADWLWVLSAGDVASFVDMRSAMATLVTYTVGWSGEVKELWVGGRPAPTGLRNWRVFWDQLVACGDVQLPQIVTLPRSHVSRSWLSRAELLKSIEYLQDLGLERTSPDGALGGDLVHFGWDGEMYSIEGPLSQDSIAKVSRNVVGVQLALDCLRPGSG